MHTNIDLILALTVGLAAALVLGYVTQRLGLSPVVGYPLAGIVIGPNTPGFVADLHLRSLLHSGGGYGSMSHLYKALLAGDNRRDVC
jgi:predicted Kef-type K+ transport protein